MRPAVLCLALLACDREADDALGAPLPDPFRVVFTADPHIIGDNYGCDPFPADRGCESNRLDSESLYRSRRRLEVARDLIHAIEPAPEAVFVAGDIMTDNYAFGADLDAYRDPALGSAAWHAKALFDGFAMPVHLGWGNHDYDDDYAFSQRLFREIFETEPYYAVEYGGWKFLMTDTQYAAEIDPMTRFASPVYGALGREQLQWVADELAEGKPTIVIGHHHPLANTLLRDEDPDGPWPDLYTVVQAHADVVRGLFFGHFHRWTMGPTWFEGVPAYILGATRYDADNFWLFEFERDGEGYEILDVDKAAWGSVGAYGATYDGQVQVDRTGDPELDPAGPWEGDWELFPPPWPPEE